MDGRPNRTPRRAACLALLLALILPVSADAQTRYVSFADGGADQPAADQKAGGATGDDILNMDIEQLARTPVVVPSMDIPVTSVTKEQNTVGRSAAAVFVITGEMIRRSGATCIPEALRMAPGIEVAQVNSSTWAITCRGFNLTYANKLLVLIDGRSVYNPDFAGVFWNVQDVLLENVERIEVVRGPGGTLWGANAVNGVINIITKRAKDTQGCYAMGGGGTHERDMEAARYGGRIGEDLYYRVYGKHFERGANFDSYGQIDDAWRQGRFGFRADWEPDRDKSNILTLQGDHYLGNTDTGMVPTAQMIGMRTTGENLLMRWRHVYDEDSDWSLQAYYDNFTISNALFSEIDRTLDVEFQYRFPWGDRQSIICGAGFRNVDSLITGGDRFGPFVPSPFWTTNYTNQFIQDEITLIEERLALTLGCKVEQNPYTGLEYQPTARLLWTPDRKRAAWGAISRAVRTPTRAEEQASFTIGPIAPDVYFRSYPGFGLSSEAVLAYEIGYREQTTDDFSWDVALFYNVYQELITPQSGMPFFEPVPPPPHLIFPSTYTNLGGADTCGVELAANYAVSKCWRIYCQYTFLHMNYFEDPSGFYDGNDPHNQVYLKSSWDLRDDVHFDLMARYVDRLSDLFVPSYISMDLRLGWQPRKELELAVVGQNLLQEHHLEYSSFGFAPTTEVPRGVYGTLTWRR